MSGTHSLLSPSGASRWMECPASVAMCVGLESKSSEYAEEGSKAHAMAEKFFKGGGIDKEDDRDMAEYVMEYIIDVIDATDGYETIWFEEKLDLSSITGEGEGGTADVMAIVGNTVQVHDLKYGKGVKVDASGNWQLILYGLGALDVATLVSDKIEKVELWIHQPRLNHTSNAIYDIVEMVEFRKQLIEGARLVREIIALNSPSGLSKIPDAFFHPSEKACKFCLAAFKCPALRKKVNDDVRGDFDTVSEYGTEELAKCFENLGMHKLWIKAVEDRVYSEMMSGRGLPGYKIVAGKASARRWIDEKEAEKLLKALKVKDMYEKKLVTPAKCEKLLKEWPERWEKVCSVIVKGEGAPTIVSVDDPRPELKINAEEFAE